MKPSPRIKVTSRSFSQNTTLRAELLAYFPKTTFNDEGYRFKQEELIAYLQEVDGIILGLEQMNSTVIHALPDLKIIAKFGVGLNNVDVEFAKSEGKSIGWTGGTNKRSVAEQALTFMIGLCRNLFTTSFYLKRGQWVKDGGSQLSGKTVGIIGCGFIGTELLRLLQPFGCELLICDLLDKSETASTLQAKQVEFSELIRRSDVISLHVPLDDSTHHFINKDRLREMKPTAYLVNTCRGPVIDQAALKHALENQMIAGAALDVFEEEPPSDLEFLALPNLMVTPHIGGNAKEAVEAMGMAAIEHLKSYFLAK
ncbi:phosphoglycerate dehydrogenase [Deltaproteobacteria bacterium TL4]